jgi:cysteine desulfurase family protein
VNPPDRIYLDNAATSWPKPESVYSAVDDYQRRIGAAAGRSGYTEALEVRQAIDQARRGVARLLGVADPRQVIFCYSGTDALNQAIHGLLRSPAHVITSAAEHNSVLRPLSALEAEGRIVVTRVPCDSSGIVDPSAIEAAWRPATRLVVLTHASNVTGALQPVAEVAAIAHRRGGLILVDAAQTLGELPVDVGALDVDLLAAPGHKGLLGPLGTGILYIRPGLERTLAPLRQGGTGSRSEDVRQPEELPDRFEAGNLNVPGIIGLGAGVEFLAEQGVAEIRRRTIALTARLMGGLAGMAGLRMFGPREEERRVGIVSLRLDGYECEELALVLDSTFGIQSRAGLHCAPAMHETLGTLTTGGTLRLSLGPFNTAEQVDQTIDAFSQVAAQAAL